MRAALRPLLLTLAVASSAGMHAQQPSNAAPVTAPSSAMTTLRANAQLTVVDVVVTDKDGKVVHGLTADDFSVIESSVAQHLTGFEDNTKQAAKPRPAMPQMAPGIYTNYSQAPADAAVNVLLIDSFNTPPQDVAYLHDQLIQYTKNAGDKRMAIFVLDDHLQMLQGFTSNSELEKAALSDPRLLQRAPQQSLNEEVRTRITIQSLSQLARYLGTIPGRKNLIWFSSGFRTQSIRLGQARGGRSSFNVNTEMKDLIDLLSQNRIAVYPVDARGSQIEPMDADPTSVDSGSSMGLAKVRNARQAAASVKNFSDTTSDQHATDDSIADETGGRALHNTNGLKEAVAEVMADGSSFYSLAYRPTATKRSDDYHAIEVKLRQKGYTLAYRHGYYTTSEAAATPGADPSNTRAASETQLALQHGAPGPMDVVFSSAVVPIAGTPTTSVANGNQAGRNLKGPYQLFTVNSSCMASTLFFAPQPDGRLRLRVQFVAMVYTPDGELVNRVSRTMDSMLTPETVKQMQTAGVRLDQEISVPVKGEYFVRVAVRDLARDTMGALEIPIQSARKVTPIVLAQTTAKTR